MLLAIDTSAGTSVAVVDLRQGIIAERGESDPMRHTETVGPLICACLEEANILPNALSGVVGGMGPGPFTGLRVGIASARVFALAAGKPLVPVISHDAIAFGHYRRGHTGPLVVVTDARRREIYWSAYSQADAVGLPMRVGSPGLAKPTELEQSGWAHAGWPRLDSATVSAGELGLVAELQYAHKRPFAANEPLYLRSPDVTLSAGPKRVSR